MRGSSAASLKGFSLTCAIFILLYPPRVAHVLTRLPSLREDIKSFLDSTLQLITDLPPPPSDNPTIELLGMVREFCADFGALVYGKEGHESLLQQCRPAHRALKNDILGTAPNFRPFKNADNDDKAFRVAIDEEDFGYGMLHVPAYLDCLFDNQPRQPPVYLEDVKSYIHG